MKAWVAGIERTYCDACGALLEGESAQPERHRDPFDCIAHLRAGLDELRRNSRLIHVKNPRSPYDASGA